MTADREIYLGAAHCLSHLPVPYQQKLAVTPGFQRHLRGHRNIVLVQVCPEQWPHVPHLSEVLHSLKPLIKRTRITSCLSERDHLERQLQEPEEQP